MKILMTGSSGFIGRQLLDALVNDGHQVVSIPRDQLYNLPSFENFDACINLAGENIIGRWTAHKKEKIWNSRIQTTKALTHLFSRLKNPPRKFLSASAIGFYGEKGDQIISENASKGQGFLCDLCEKWEMSANEAKNLGIQVVNMRFGIVLGKGGGILPKMSFPVHFGNGNQYISWIHIKDLIQGIAFILDNSIEGPVNLCAPNAVKQKEFANTLAKILHRPSFFHLPAWLLKIVLGQMAQEMLLCSTRGYPDLLLKKGFSFQFPNLKDALTDIYCQILS